MTQSIRRIVNVGQGIYGDRVVDSQRIGIVRTLSREGRTLTQIQDFLRAEGLPLRRQSIVEIRQEVRRLERSQGRLNTLEPRFRPTRDMITRTRINLQTEYRYTARVTTIDPRTGESKGFFARFGDSRQLTGEEFRDRVMSMTGEAIEIYGSPDDVEIEFLGIEQRAGG